MKKLIDEVTRREGKKKSVSRAQVAEILGIVSDILSKETVGNNWRTVDALIRNGIKRAAMARRKK